MIDELEIASAEAKPKRFLLHASSSLFERRIPIISLLMFCFAALGLGYQIGASGWRKVTESALSAAQQNAKTAISALESARQFCWAYNVAAEKAHLLPADCNFERRKSDSRASVK
jgi:hypothetical protein